MVQFEGFVIIYHLSFYNVCMFMFGVPNDSFLPSVEESVPEGSLRFTSTSTGLQSLIVVVVGLRMGPLLLLLGWLVAHLHAQNCQDRCFPYRLLSSFKALDAELPPAPVQSPPSTAPQVLLHPL